MQRYQSVTHEEKLRKQLQAVKISFIKQGSTLTKFCNEKGINHSHAFRVFSGKWKGEKADQLKQRLIEASKGKNNGNHQNTD